MSYFPSSLPLSSLLCWSVPSNTPQKYIEVGGFYLTKYEQVKWVWILFQGTVNMLGLFSEIKYLRKSSTCKISCKSCLICNLSWLLVGAKLYLQTMICSFKLKLNPARYYIHGFVLCDKPDRSYMRDKSLGICCFQNICSGLYTESAVELDSARRGELLV